MALTQTQKIAFGIGAVVVLMLAYHMYYGKKGTSAFGFRRAVQSRPMDRIELAKLAADEDLDMVPAEIMVPAPSMTRAVRRQNIRENTPLINTHEYDTE